MKFKVGDRVRCVDNPNPFARGAGYSAGKKIVIHHFSENAGDPIYWPQDGNGVYESDIELVEPKQTITMKISNAFKKFLNADLQAQVKAGYRDGNLELTQEGKEVLLEILASDKSAELTKTAQEKIAEEEKK
jgi:hypothetical protein